MALGGFALPEISRETMADSREQKKISEYLYQLTEQLRFVLTNLDGDNFAQGAMEKEIAKSALVREIRENLEDDRGNIHTLSLTADELKSEIADANGNISTFTQTAQRLESEIADANGNISTLTQTAEKLESKITDANGNITKLTQTASGIEAAVNASKLSFDASGLHIKNGGFEIRNKDNTRVLYADTNGNLTLNGKVNATSGTIGGFTIEENTLSGGGVTLYASSGIIRSEYGTNRTDIHRSSLLFYENGNQSAQIDVGEYGVRIFTMGGSESNTKGDIALLLRYGALYIGGAADGGENRIICDNPATTTGGSANVRWVQRKDEPYKGRYSLGYITSSRRYKKNIEPVARDAGAIIDKIRPVTYEPRTGEETGVYYGFIAEEMEEAAPLLCTYIEQDGKKVIQSVQYDRVPVLLVKDAQQTHRRLAAIEKWMEEKEKAK